jgi:hypothetical protein
MTDPVLTFILLALFFLAIAGTRWFKTLDTGFGRAAATPVLTGIACGVILLFVPYAAATGILLTIAAIYVRHTGDESEAPEGMLLGALIGASAALPLAFSGEAELRKFAEVVIAGTIAGYGITFAAFHVADRLKQLVLDVVTAAAAVGGAAAPSLLARTGVTDRRIAITVAIAIPVLSILTVFVQWRHVRTELADESALGFVDPRDVRATAHPILRLGRAGWTNAHAHREFVRLANRIALRKRQQRGRPEAVARLYQLEIIKLRMQLQEMAKIDRAMRDQTDTSGQ